MKFDILVNWWTIGKITMDTIAFYSTTAAFYTGDESSTSSDTV